MSEVPQKVGHPERGIASIEYAVMAMLVALALIGGLGAVGTALNSMFQLAADVFP